jgi:predicted GNAT family N-acyltransferase
VSDPGFRIDTGSWAECDAGARAVRTAVFIEEQGIPPEDEWDAADAGAVHALARDAVGRCIGTARLLVEPTGLADVGGAEVADRGTSGVARIGRVAVLRSWRGQQVGVALMQALSALARARGDHAVVLSAQCSAQGFYTRLGFVAEGDIYDDAGIAHITMRRAL